MSQPEEYGPDKSDLWSSKPQRSTEDVREEAEADFRISFEKMAEDDEPVDNAKRGSTVKRSEPPLRINASKMAGPVRVDNTGRVATGGQGRTYWNVMTEPPAMPGKARSAKFVFEPSWENPYGAVGMLPLAVKKRPDLDDWLGFQEQSVAVWLDGQ